MRRFILISICILLSFLGLAQEQEKYYLSVKPVLALGFNFNTNDTEPIVENARGRDFSSVSGFHLEIGYRSKEKIFFGFVVRHVAARNLPRFGWGEMHEVDIKDYFTGFSMNYPFALKNDKFAITPAIEIGLLNPHYVTRTGSDGILERESGGQFLKYSIGTDVFYKVYKHCQVTAGISYADNLTSLLIPEEVNSRSRIFQISTGIRISI